MLWGVEGGHQWGFQGPWGGSGGVTGLLGAAGGLTARSPPLQAKVVANNDKNRTFSVSYVPKVTGVHKVGSEGCGGALWGLRGPGRCFEGGAEAFWGPLGLFEPLVCCSLFF